MRRRSSSANITRILRRRLANCRLATLAKIGLLRHIRRRRSSTSGLRQHRGLAKLAPFLLSCFKPQVAGFIIESVARPCWGILLLARYLSHWIEMCVFGSALGKLFSRAIFDWIGPLLIAPKWGISLPVVDDDERVIWQRVRINLSRHFWRCWLALWPLM